MTDHAAIVQRALSWCEESDVGNRHREAALAALAALEQELAEAAEREKVNARAFLAQIDWRKVAEAERDEARRLLREVVKADRQDAQMGYPIPGDSCMGAFIGLVLMRYLAELDDPPPTEEGT